MPVLPDLSKQVGTVAGNEIAGDYIGHASVKPTPNRRIRDVRLGEEKAKPSSIRISRLADRFADPIVVATSREGSLHAMDYRQSERP